MAKKKAKKKIKPSAKQTGHFLSDLDKRGQLNPKHHSDFNQLLDDVAPPAKKKK